MVKEYEFPIIEGNENEEAIDIKKLRDSTGIITLDPGYKIQVLVLVKLHFGWRLDFCVTGIFN
jgi:hypothetical protein